MGEVQQKLKNLEARQQQLASNEARAEATLERAHQDYEQARDRLKAMGFETVDAAQQWLSQASQEVSQQIEDIERVLTEAGV